VTNLQLGVKGEGSSGASQLSAQLAGVVGTDSALLLCHVCTFPALLTMVSHEDFPWSPLGGVHARSTLRMSWCAAPWFSFS
jgi:hypothetical protein